jgi:hypothetical protein
MTIWHPYEYQGLMVKHAFKTRRCALWASMGMGKTSTVFWFLEAMVAAGEIPFPVLVIGPLRVARDVWPAEAAKWENFQHLKIQPIIGSIAERKAALRNDKAHIYTVNYDVLPWLMEQFNWQTWPFRVVVADEAVRLKNFRLGSGGSIRADALSNMAFPPNWSIAALDAAYHKRIYRWINLTGMPTPNGLIDLWGQTWFLDQGYRLGRTFTDFQNRWFGIQRAGQFGSNRFPFPHSEEEIAAKLKDICLTVDARDWLPIEEPIHKVVPVTLPPAAFKLYREMEKKLYIEINGHEVEAFNTAGKSMKCLQLASGFVFTDAEKEQWEAVHNEKIEALKSIISEANGEPIICAYFFKPSLERLMKAFPYALNLNLKEGMAAFKAGRSSLGFGHPQSIGHGTDGLQHRSHIAVFYESWWDIDPDQQFIDRVGPVRQLQAGFKRPTWVYRIVAERTVDEDVLERQTTKRTVAECLLEGMKQRS